MARTKLPALAPIEEQPYAVPENWIWVRGTNCLLPMTTKKPTGDFFLYIDIDAIDNEIQAVSSPKKLPVNEAPSRASREVMEGDTLFSMVRPYLRNIAYIDAGLANCIASTGFFVCRPSALLNGKYLFKLMISGYMVDGLNSYMKGDNSPSIRQENIWNFPYPLPPLPEQHRIVERIESLFEKLDRAKELVQSALDSFETRKAAILHKAFTGELTAKWREENDVGLESWEEKTLDDVAEYKKGPFGSSITKAMFLPKGQNTYKVYEQGNAIRKTLDYGRYYISKSKFDELKGFAIAPGDIIISCAGTIGEVFKIPENCEAGVINQALMRVRVKTACIVEKYFILYFGEILKGDITNQANGTAIKNIPPFSVMKAMHISLPTLPEQHEIVRILDSLFEKEHRARELCDVIEKIELMKKAILARAFRGELGTNDPGEESAAGLVSV